MEVVMRVSVRCTMVSRAKARSSNVRRETAERMGEVMISEQRTRVSKETERR